jgi:hypothetical protein
MLVIKTASSGRINRLGDVSKWYGDYAPASIFSKREIKNLWSSSVLFLVKILLNSKNNKF